MTCPSTLCVQTEEMNAQVVEVGGRMLEAPGPKRSFSCILRFLKTRLTYLFAVTGGLEALRKGQMTVFLAGEKAKQF